MLAARIQEEHRKEHQGTYLPKAVYHQFVHRFSVQLYGVLKRTFKMRIVRVVSPVNKAETAGKESGRAWEDDQENGIREFQEGMPERKGHIP